MTITKLLSLTATTLALMATPALAQSPTPSHPSGRPTTTPTSTSNPGTTNKPADTPTSTSNPGSSHSDATPGANASANAKGKAYGRYCQTESKQHTAGQHGTPFSQCVTAMAKLANGVTNNPRTACKDESKQHTAGQHGTPFSLCISGAAKLLQNQS
jgi:hypothetical protein